MSNARGTLFVVSTPIGNLQDSSDRLRHVLQSVSLIACEDTRRTRKLLSAFSIRARLSSFHGHSGARKCEALLSDLEHGQDVALVSDSGTPLVSDPGSELVRLATERGITVTAIPGPSAVLAALVVSGLPSDRFTFEGFLPRKSGARRRALQELVSEKRTMIFFEAPHRVLETLAEMLLVLGDRRAFAGRELTKKFEEKIYGRLSEIAAHLSLGPPRGEFVIVVAGGAET